MTHCTSEIEYLEKYAVAPSPSRDYHGIKVFRNEVIFYTWKITHGPHTSSPVVRVCGFSDFKRDKTIQTEIERIFGKPLLKHVLRIVEGNGNSLLTLPKNLIQKLVGYLNLRDVVNISKLSRMAKDVFNGDIVWDILYKRYKMGLVFRDEKEQAASYGWKNVFKERQLHKPVKERKLKSKIFANDQPLLAARSSSALKKLPETVAKNKKILSARQKICVRPKSAIEKQQISVEDSTDKKSRQSSPISEKSLDRSRFQNNSKDPVKPAPSYSKIKKPVVSENLIDSGLEDLVKASVSGKYLNSEDLMKYSRNYSVHDQIKKTNYSKDNLKKKVVAAYSTELDSLSDRSSGTEILQKKRFPIPKTKNYRITNHTQDKKSALTTTPNKLLIGLPKLPQVQKKSIRERNLPQVINEPKNKEDQIGNSVITANRQKKIISRIKSSGSSTSCDNIKIIRSSKSTANVKCAAITATLQPQQKTIQVSKKRSILKN